MNKDTNLIFEAYVEESKSRAAILSIMCALGLGCSSIQPQQPGENAPMPPKKKSEIERILDNIGKGILGNWLLGVSDEEKHELRSAILRQSELGTPEEGWERWFHNWSNNQKI